MYNDHLLLLHLQRPSVSTVYDLPALTTWIGVFFMAFGYGIDINERIVFSFLIFHDEV